MRFSKEENLVRTPLYGIEQEIALLRDDGSFLDYTNTKHSELQPIVDQLPVYKEDYPRLRVGDLQIKRKRWYVEGYERFNKDGTLNESVPKGMEIRTTPHLSINEALKELGIGYLLLKEKLNSIGFRTTWVSYNPVRSAFEFDPPLNEYELKMRSNSPEDQTANIAQMTFGPDLNLSFPGLSDEELISAGKRLTFFSPYIVPFSFSSPFKNNALWGGLSLRTYLRTGKRPAALVFLHDDKNHVPTTPSLTQHSRVAFEKGRIEFKAFDTCNDTTLYYSLFVLLKGIILNDRITEASSIPSVKLHQLSAIEGFMNSDILAGAKEAIGRAEEVLSDPAEIESLDRLKRIVKSNSLPVYTLINEYKKNHSVIKTLMSFENLMIS